MELICPECRSNLQTVDHQTATCRAHGENFRILFNREGSPAASSPAMPEPEPTSKTCPMCNTVIGLSAGHCAQCGYTFGLLNLQPARRESRMTGTMCAQHREVEAVNRCRICASPMCVTCEFVLPGDMHVCPSCIEKEPSKELSSKRLILMIIGIACAFLGSLVLIFARTGALHRALGNSEATNVLIGNLMIWPAVAGMACSLVAYDRRLHNSFGIHVARIWNAVNLGIFLLFMIIGLMRKG
jgi:hypothetical protein